MTLHTSTETEMAKGDVEMMEVPREEQVANITTGLDHHETVVQAIKNHKGTVAWMIYGIWLVLTASFDNSAAGGVVSIPGFRKDFGYLYNGEYVLHAKWLSAFNGGPAASSVIGSFASGFIADKFGRKYTMLTAFVLLFVGITIETVANTTPAPNAVFFAGKFVNGLGVGIQLVTSMVYIGELSPLRLRGIAIAAGAITFTVAGLILSLISNKYAVRDDSWSYKSAFVAQYGVTGIAALIWPFAPESPYWLLSAGKVQGAERAYRRLGETGIELHKRMAVVQTTLEEARKETEGVTYRECFRKSNLRRTIIALAPLSIQSFSGIFWIAGYATYYYQMAGFTDQGSFHLAIIQQVLSLLGNVTAWFLIDRVGRRGLSLYGLIGLTVILAITGGLAVKGTVAATKGASAMIIVYCYFYNVTIGATAYVAMSEVATSRLRQKTAAIALLVQGCFSTMWSFIIPYLFNPDQADLGAKTAFIFMGLSILCCVYFYYYHPETAGRSYEELDEMFRKGVTARQFGTYETDVQKASRQSMLEMEIGKTADYCGQN